MAWIVSAWHCSLDVIVVSVCLIISIVTVCTFVICCAVITSRVWLKIQEVFCILISDTATYVQWLEETLTHTRAHPHYVHTYMRTHMHTQTHTYTRISVAHMYIFCWSSMWALWRGQTRICNSLVWYQWYHILWFDVGHIHTTRISGTSMGWKWYDLNVLIEIILPYNQQCFGQVQQIAYI